MASSKKKIIIVIAVLFIMAIITGLYLYNKAPNDVRGSKGLPVDAVMLYKTYSNDTLIAQKKFTGKILRVTGEVANTSANQQGEILVLLKTADTGAYINCTLTEGEKEPAAGASVTIKGICSGMGQGEPELGIKGDVYLTRCVINN
jgi:cytochrome c-type biogenesis protein CcmE